MSRPAARILKRPEHAHGGAARGATFIFFFLIALPALFFSAGLSVDVARIIVAGQQARNAASAAALAGALEVNPGTSDLNQSRARQEAGQTWRASVSAGAMPLVTDPDGSSKPEPQVSFPGRNEVEVSATFRVKGLVFAQLLGALGPDSTGIGADGRRLGVFTAYGQAYVCNPNETDNPTGGQCARPRLTG